MLGLGVKVSKLRRKGFETIVDTCIGASSRGGGGDSDAVDRKMLEVSASAYTLRGITYLAYIDKMHKEAA
jgi:hypothetical protein